MNVLTRYSGVPVRFKHIIARRFEQVNLMKERLAFKTLRLILKILLWNNPFLEDTIIRGYTDEMRDFMDSIYYDREPKSGFDLAYDSIKIIYAAYKS